MQLIQLADALVTTRAQSNPGALFESEEAIAEAKQRFQWLIDENFQTIVSALRFTAKNDR